MIPYVSRETIKYRRSKQFVFIIIHNQNNHSLILIVNCFEKVKNTTYIKGYLMIYITIFQSFFGAIFSLFPIYILNACGILTDPSACKLFSKKAINILGGATTVLFKVCA